MTPAQIDNIRGFLDGLRPVPRLSVSEWSDKYRYLSTSASAEAGLWRTSRTPYLKEILDNLSEFSQVQEIVGMKGAQLGWTEAGNNWLGYIIDICPAPVLMVMPTDDTVKRNSKMRIDPMLESSPTLRQKIKPARSRDSGNTTYMKEFAGGVLVMTGANSAVGLRSMPIRFLFLDEIDGYPLDLDGEGSPISLAEARTRTFSRKKIFKISTPTIEGQSAIAAEFESTDQRYYHVPCPHCGHRQNLIFDNLKWEAGKPETVQYHCCECGAGIEERHKPYMLQNGEWVQHKPQNSNPKRVGYHINSLYSPYGWYSWADAASDYEKAIADKSGLLMKTFTNTVLGQTHKEKSDAPEWEKLYERREKYLIGVVPAQVAFLTAGVDVQKDRIEMEVVGWCKGKRTYSVCYEVLLGETNEKTVWDKLKVAITRSFLRADGMEMQISMTAVDTGYNTTEVYKFCRQFDYSKVIPIKGQEHQNVVVSNPKAVEVNRKGKKINGVKIWHVGTSICKSELYSWLRLNKYEETKPDGEHLTPEGYCHFPEYGSEYFKGLTAEQLQLKTDSKGYAKYYWVKVYERNEPLDCRVYARAAAAVFGLDRFTDRDFDRLALNPSPRPPAAQVQKQEPHQTATKKEFKFNFSRNRD